MKRILILCFLTLASFQAFSQSNPVLTTGTRIKFFKGDTIWMDTVGRLASLLSTGGTVTSVTFSTLNTGLTVSGNTSQQITSSGTFTLAGTLDADNGGTGISSYAVGDLLYANTTTSLDKLADVATGNVLLSGGIGVAPSYGKVGLTTHVTGTLPATNGGTGLNTTTSGALLVGAASNTNQYLTPAITTSNAAIAYTVSGSNYNLNIPDASTTFRGTVNTASQTFAGAKTFVSGVTVENTDAVSLKTIGVTASNWNVYSANQTLTLNNNFVEIGQLTGNITLTLPECTTTEDGIELSFLKTGTDGFSVKLIRSGSNQFTDGSTEKLIYSQGTSATCKCKFTGGVGRWYYVNN